MKQQTKRAAPRSIRIDSALEAWIVERAKQGDRSVNAEINRALRTIKALEERKAQAQKSAA
ncbi:hypothetical protein [Thiothrix nivea]|uniref:Arc-like DNA binding domain-containing protein n=1 Tax=Thiothrix nivea (strain ATCC 35100 / DSM 5205 / JP2) TaxID=870187 RepID=A0A656HIM3_THINJ|nr:hypothetical protein [Thiothrix nivea]EIJ36223.1 hypothetical protein Thini_3720 [Thiothrix nivea DSM 5205]